MSSSPSSPANSAAAGSQSSTDVASIGGRVGDVRRVADDHVEPLAVGQRLEPRPCTDPDVDGRPTDPGQVGAGDRERVVADVGQPHRGADRPAARPPATVRSRRTRCRGRRPTRCPGTARARLDRHPGDRARSRAAGSAPDDRPRDRDGGTTSGRARTGSGSPLRYRASIASRWTTIRSVTGSSRTASNSSPSSPSATSHSHRASCRGRRLGVVSAPERAHADSGRSRSRQPSNVGELLRPLVDQQRLDHQIEIAGQHVGESVDREPDAVVGDPVLLEVVGADLLAAAAAADL